MQSQSCRPHPPPPPPLPRSLPPPAAHFMPRAALRCSWFGRTTNSEVTRTAGKKSGTGQRRFETRVGGGVGAYSMSSYGGPAALVVNKQETDRERRLRLRREEFLSRNGAGAPPEEHGASAAGQAGDRSDYSRGPAPDSGGYGRHPPPRPAGREQGEGSGGGEGGYPSQPGQHPAGGANEPASRESIWEAKRRRYLELYVPTRSPSSRGAPVARRPRCAARRRTLPRSRHPPVRETDWPRASPRLPQTLEAAAGGAGSAGLPVQGAGE